MNGSVQVLVRVRDINDNAPYFEQTLYHSNVSENMGSGVDVIRLTAIDRDVDSIVRYSIEVNRVNSEGELIFDIDELSGVVSTAVCCLDRESIDSFTIKVCATDEAISGDAAFHWSTGGKSTSGPKGKGGTKAASSTKSPLSGSDNQTDSCTSVVIDITDENDESPRFVRDKYFLSLPEGVNELYPGRVLLNTTVTDGDLPETNRFACRLAGAIRFPSLSTTKGADHSQDQQHNDTFNNNQQQQLPAGIYTQPMSLLHLRKFFSCEVNGTSGNVRLLVVETGAYEPEKFYRSLVTEWESYRQSVSAGFASTMPETVELQFRLTITDVGVFEAVSVDDQPIEQRLTNADLGIKFATVKPQLGVGGGQGGHQGSTSTSSGANETGANLQPSLAVVVTKQISPNGYNSESGFSLFSGNDLFGSIRAKWAAHVTNNKNGFSTLLLAGSAAILLVIACTTVVFLFVFRFRNRMRRGGNGNRKRNGSFDRTSSESIPGAICCMAVSGGGSNGSASLPITSHEEEQSNSGTTTSEHQFGGICPTYSVLEGEMSGRQSVSGHHSHHHQFHQQTLNQQPSLYSSNVHPSHHHHHQYGQLAEQMSSGTPESSTLFNCHSATNSANNSTSGRTNTGSSILSDTNYLLDAYGRTKSPSTLDGSTDTSGGGPHLVLLESTNEQHHHQHHHLGSANSHSHYDHQQHSQHSMNTLSNHQNHQQYSDQLTTYGFEINAPYDTIALYDLTHLQTIPLQASSTTPEENSKSSRCKTSAFEQLEMSQLCSNTVVLSTTNSAAGTPVLPDVISKVQQQNNGQSLCDTTGNFLLINTSSSTNGNGQHHHQLLSSPSPNRNNGHSKV